MSDLVLVVDVGAGVSLVALAEAVEEEAELDLLVLLGFGAQEGAVTAVAHGLGDEGAGTLQAATAKDGGTLEYGLDRGRGRL